MNFTIMDPNSSLFINILLVIANIINLVYNIPQMIQTYKTRSTGDFSTLFLFLRVVSNFIWIIYSVSIDSMLMLINSIVTVIATTFIGYFKYIEYRKKQKSLEDEGLVNTSFNMVNTSYNTSYNTDGDVINYDVIDDTSDDTSDDCMQNLIIDGKVI